jgi:hypothetical protein
MAVSQYNSTPERSVHDPKLREADPGGLGASPQKIRLFIYSSREQEGFIG